MITAKEARSALWCDATRLEREILKMTEIGAPRAEFMFLAEHEVEYLRSLGYTVEEKYNRWEVSW